ncbi:P-loop ATPase, Sll1717 family [Lactococcus cremoris]|uniref:P-loop ATPase, Sll1717 family n=1 Tax=Lactococcus lactis subsp. cremoris TaxID=1359 RepID=UPI0003ABA76F|nr:hypothetical protein [Lactococcus cremoris]AGV72850.1 hypothetical protein kw2_0892 [Lactococcus cremoris subsp. cremoris KW2]
MQLKNIDFGKADGAKEAMLPNFSEMFYEEGGHYDVLNNTDKFLIIGRKGTGKTTLSSYAHKKFLDSSNNLSRQCFANDFTKKKLLNFADNEINREENSLFWEYVFLLEIGEELSEYYNSKKFFSPLKIFQKNNVKKLKRMLDSEHSRIENIVTSNTYEEGNNVGTSVGKLAKVNANSSLKASETESVTKRTIKYYEELPELKKLVLSLLKKSKKRVTIFYDDMDQFEEDIEYNYFMSLMKNMIYSADALNNILAEYNSSKICLVLRRDIIDYLQHITNNLNKQITDSGIEIRWFNTGYKEPAEHPLMKMILHKIKKSYNEELGSLSLSEIHNIFFEKDVFEFLMKRSFGRPRDLISYLNFYKEHFPTSEKITINNLVKIEQTYSRWFNDELLNELKISETKSSIKKVLEVISKRGLTTFTIKKLTKFAIEKTEDGEMPNLLEDLKKMRDYSILGIQLQNGNVDFTYRLGHSPSVDNKTKFRVHQGLKKYLNLKP